MEFQFLWKPCDSVGKALEERLKNEIIRAHLEPEQLIDIIVLGSQLDNWELGVLAQSAQQFYAVHARHLDV